MKRRGQVACSSTVKEAGVRVPARHLQHSQTQYRYHFSSCIMCTWPYRVLRMYITFYRIEQGLLCFLTTRTDDWWRQTFLLGSPCKSHFLGTPVDGENSNVPTLSLSLFLFKIIIPTVSRVYARKYNSFCRIFFLLTRHKKCAGKWNWP